jgi:hypothetical protein
LQRLVVKNGGLETRFSQPAILAGSVSRTSGFLFAGRLFLVDL